MLTSGARAVLLVPMLGVERDSLLIEQGGGHVLQILLQVIDAVVNPGNLNCVLSRRQHEGGVGGAEEQGGGRGVGQVLEEL